MPLSFKKSTLLCNLQSEVKQLNRSATQILTEVEPLGVQGYLWLHLHPLCLHVHPVKVIHVIKVKLIPGSLTTFGEKMDHAYGL